MELRIKRQGTETAHKGLYLGGQQKLKEQRACTQSNVVRRPYCSGSMDIRPELILGRVLHTVAMKASINLTSRNSFGLLTFKYQSTHKLTFSHETENQ